MLRIHLLTALLALPLLAAGESPPPARALVAQVPLTEAEAAALLEHMRAGGFNTLILDAFVRGEAIYPSAVFPQRADLRDSLALPRLLAQCREREWRVWAGVRTLNWGPPIPTTFPRRGAGSSSLLERHTEWLDRNANALTSDAVERGTLFVSPSSPEVRRRLRDFCLELGEHLEVDGIVFDEARGPRDPKQRAHFGYAGAARTRFLRDTGTDPIQLDPPGRDATDQDLAQWIRWTAWRENEISTLVYELSAAFREGTRRRGVRGLVAATVVPGYYRERGRSTMVQDWARWAREGYLDAVIPRLEAVSRRTLERDLDSVRARLQESPTIQLVPMLTWRKGTRSLELGKQLDFVQTQRLDSFALFRYEALAGTPEQFRQFRR